MDVVSSTWWGDEANQQTKGENKIRFWDRERAGLEKYHDYRKVQWVWIYVGLLNMDARAEGMWARA